MADHQHRKPSTSGVRADIDLIDIDQVIVIPETPDRTSKQSKSIYEISISRDSSLKNCVRGNRVIRDKRNRLFSDSVQAVGFNTHPGDDAARSQGAVSLAAPPSSRHVQQTNMISGKTIKHEYRHHCYNQEMEDDRILRSSFGGISSHHHRSEKPVLVDNGDVAKYSPKFKKQDLGDRKMDKALVLSSNIVPLLTTRVSSKSTRNDDKRKEMEDDRILRSSFGGLSSHHYRSENPVLVDNGDVAKYSPKFKKHDLWDRKMDEVHLLSSNIVPLHTAGVFSKSTRKDDKGKVKVGHDDRSRCNALIYEREC